MFRCNVDLLFEKSRIPKRTQRMSVSKPLTRSLRLERLEGRTLLTVNLGTADNFAVLGGSAVTNTGPTVLTGDLGVSPGSAISGFPPGIVNGTIYATDAVAAQAESDLTTAYNAAASEAITADLTGQNLGGLTLTPGVYFFASSAQLTGTLTLNFQGNPNAQFVFQIGSTLTTASNSSVQVINDGGPCNVYWQVGSSATLGTTTTFVGHILALTSISLQTGASVQGSALARNGAVTMDDNVVSNAACFTGSISGTKFNDVNGDGIQESGDTGLAGLTVYLDTNNNDSLDVGEISATTDANGAYTFTHLAPGTYHVLEVQQAGVLQTTPNPAPITLAAGQAVSGVNFGDFREISISGSVFQDTNGNGVRDTGEAGLAGVTVFLDTNNNGVLNSGEISTTTNASGNFTFVNLGPGIYHVVEVQQPGFVQMTNSPSPITVSSGVNVTGVLFGEIPVNNLVTVSKLVFTGQNLVNLLDGVFASEANYVANLYETLLGRAPDLAGLTSYLRLLQSGYTETQVTAIFKTNFHL